ncbi:MAG: ribonuclease PH [Syntrophales bacterium]|nr:ribonuclease PH [Syntrophales bacterium]MDD5233586.1 ribonuclease PH [Syntrophales bacterium]MDD5532450.1 ribonuclease PH [Syntrophales bacterium]
MRPGGRARDEIRPVRITPDFIGSAAGSVLVEIGGTRVICTATMEEGVPPFLKGSGRGWLTAEYAMIPAATHTRSDRESARGRIGGRTHEIQRLIGRSLRAVTNLTAFGERTIHIDCDVIQADGGTRTASITGGFVALVLALRRMKQTGLVRSVPVADFLSAVSAGVVKDEVLLDLDYREDSGAAVDMNVVMTRGGMLVEIQGTAEQRPFSLELFDEMIGTAKKGIARLTEKQAEVLGEIF